MDQDKIETRPAPTEWSQKVNWPIAFYNLVLHVAVVYGAYLIISLRICVATGLWAFVMFGLGGIGTGVGSHRFFSHRSFKATQALKIFLLFIQTIAGQLSVFHWVQTHRIHHKFTDTDRDPSNINRGFFFAYVGNYFLPRHPDCQREWERIDLNDLKADSDVMFQDKQYGILWAVFAITIPTIVPIIFWKETLWISLWMNLFRIFFNMTHVGFSNSFNHLFGKRPFDGRIQATDNFLMNLWTFGDGNHNYHHTFPRDYKGAEHSGLKHFNILATMIHVFEMFGLAYELKITSPEMIAKRLGRTGDGSYIDQPQTSKQETNEF